MHVFFLAFNMSTLSGDCGNKTDIYRFKDKQFICFLIIILNADYLHFFGSQTIASAGKLRIFCVIKKYTNTKHNMNHEHM